MGAVIPDPPSRADGGGDFGKPVPAHQPLAGSAPVAVPTIVVAAPELNVVFAEIGTIKKGNRPLDALRCKLKRRKIAQCGVAGVF